MITMLLLLLAAFILGYCTARCSEEERRCETWRDGVRFGAAYKDEWSAPVEPEPTPKAEASGTVYAELPY